MFSGSPGPMQQSNRSPHRIACRCRTVMMFPAGTTARKCWQCGSVVEAASGALTAPTSTARLQSPGPAARLQAATSAARLQSSFSQSQPSNYGHNNQLRRPGGMSRPHGEASGFATSSLPGQVSPSRPQGPDAQWLFGQSQHPAEVKEHTRSSPQMPAGTGCTGLSVLLFALLIGFVGSAVFTLMPSSQQLGLPSAKTKPGDTDGDGIPDIDDFCSRRGWISGPVTDFDGDGCEDGIEDDDKDNDGIKDVDDGCPSTPMHFGFESHDISDFDGDGCADTIEDLDNDADAVPNSVDRCPRTLTTEPTVDAGCSLRQVLAPQQQVDPSWWELLTCRERRGPMNFDEELTCKTCWEWAGELKSAWKQIFAGAVVAFFMSTVQNGASVIQEQMPEAPIDSLRKRISTVSFPDVPAGIAPNFAWSSIHSSSFRQDLSFDAPMREAPRRPAGLPAELGLSGSH